MLSPRFLPPLAAAGPCHSFPHSVLCPARRCGGKGGGGCSGCTGHPGGHPQGSCALRVWRQPQRGRRGGPAGGAASHCGGGVMPDLPGSVETASGGSRHPALVQQPCITVCTIPPFCLLANLLANLARDTSHLYLFVCMHIIIRLRFFVACKFEGNTSFHLFAPAPGAFASLSENYTLDFDSRMLPSTFSSLTRGELAVAPEREVFAGAETGIALDMLLNALPFRSSPTTGN